jgi:hypothetical protein
MKYKVNPVKATCQNLGYGDGIQTVNDTCFGVCAAFSKTLDTYEMDPQCVKSCEKLVEEKRIQTYGVGSCDHQAPYRPVFWGQTPHFMPTLLDKGMDLVSAKKKCYSMCAKVPELMNECLLNCKIDSDAVEIQNPEVEKNTKSKLESKPEPKIESKQAIKSENLISESNSLPVLIIFMAILAILVIMSFKMK